MSTPPWETYNISGSKIGNSIDIVELLTAPLNSIPDLALILTLISITLIIFGVTHIKYIYKSCILKNCKKLILSFE
ncbi:MAG: hypothetical protein QW775_02710 [Ignisphaera sp.]|uniref:Uncharacterized protein n=1 Tax=Ignisphaera aggregans TaxID=334771 RepID=A0A7C4NKY7_9CREN